MSPPRGFTGSELIKHDSVVGRGSDGNNYVIEEWCEREVFMRHFAPSISSINPPRVGSHPSNLLLLPDGTPVKAIEEGHAYEIVGRGVIVKV